MEVDNKNIPNEEEKLQEVEEIQEEKNEVSLVKTLRANKWLGIASIFFGFISLCLGHLGSYSISFNLSKYSLSEAFINASGTAFFMFIIANLVALSFEFGKQLVLLDLLARAKKSVDSWWVKWVVWAVCVFTTWILSGYGVDFFIADQSNRVETSEELLLISKIEQDSILFSTATTNYEVAQQSLNQAKKTLADASLSLTQSMSEGQSVRRSWRETSGILQAAVEDAQSGVDIALSQRTQAQESLIASKSKLVEVRDSEQGVNIVLGMLLSLLVELIIGLFLYSIVESEKNLAKDDTKTKEELLLDRIDSLIDKVEEKSVIEPIVEKVKVEETPKEEEKFRKRKAPNKWNTIHQTIKEKVKSILEFEGSIEEMANYYLTEKDVETLYSNAEEINKLIPNTDRYRSFTDYKEAFNKVFVTPKPDVKKYLKDFAQGNGVKQVAAMSNKTTQTVGNYSRAYFKPVATLLGVKIVRDGRSLKTKETT